MRSTADDSPSFFKILLDDSVDCLPLPPAFAKQHLEEKLRAKAVLRTGTRESWVVKMEKIGGKYCLVNGWLQFMRDNEVEVGDFLVFRLAHGLTFSVSVYGPSGCEKKKLNPPVVNSFSDTVSEENGVDSSPEGSHGSFSRSCRETEQQKEEQMSKEEQKSEEESDSWSSETSPWFLKLVKKSHRYAMPLSSTFARESGLVGQESTELRDEEGRVWPVSIGKSGYNRLHLMSGGWVGFHRANRLQEGDTCIFLSDRAGKGDSIAVEVMRKDGKVKKRGRGRPKKGSAT